MATSYYRPYLPSDSENSDADTTSTSSTPTSSTPDSPRPENAGPDIQLPENTGPDFAALAAAVGQLDLGRGRALARRDGRARGGRESAQARDRGQQQNKFMMTTSHSPTPPSPAPMN